MTLGDRIREVIQEAGGRMYYDDCLRAVFPREKYPRAFEYATGGGPPACGMAFGKALKAIGGQKNHDRDGRKYVWLPSSNAPLEGRGAEGGASLSKR